MVLSLRILLLVLLPVAVQAAETEANADQKQHFDVLEYRVLGNTVLDNRSVEGVLYPRLGRDKTFADVDAARAALESAYHAAGFSTVFVDIPPQQVDEGIVRLHVSEGRLHVRTISGARYYSERKLLAELPSTAPGTVPNLSKLQGELTAVNSETVDRSVVPILKAGPEPGTMDLALKVDDHLPLHGSLEVNNQQSPDTKPLRTTAALSYDNLFADLDSFSAQYTFTPQKWGQVGLLGLNYAFHPVGDGIRPSLSFTNSSSNVTTLGTAGVVGGGQIVSGHLAIPLLRSVTVSQFLTLGADYKHFRNTLDLLPSANSAVVVEPVSYVNLSLGYNGNWQQFKGGISDSSTTPVPLRNESLSLTADVGPRGVANNSGDFALARTYGKGNYAYLRSDASLLWHLPANWQFLARFDGQVALEELVVYEQLPITGADSIRGYLEGEDLGDNAYRLTLQLQGPPIRHHSYVLADGFVFFDAGQSHFINALPGEASHTQLRSVGFGLQLFPGHAVSGVLEWADPLLAGPRTPAHHDRVLFDLKGSF